MHDSHSMALSMLMVGHYNAHCYGALYLGALSVERSKARSKERYRASGINHD
jgi:hypothetical protein